jgi:hypothetical protein
MTEANSTAPVVPLDAGQANLELAESLREVATWLEMHAGDLPQMHGSVSYAAFGPGARGQLSAIAEALGDRADEIADGNHVEVGASFSRMRVYGWTTPQTLGARKPPTPPYEPIIAVDPPVTSAEDEAWSERR